MIESHLKKELIRVKGKRVLIIGDLMLDEHIWSKVSRISPEAPVIIADVSRISHVPGGCGNVASNIKTLGGIPVLASLIGADSSGEKLLHALKQNDISTANIIKSDKRPTILKSRIIAGSQQIIRVDREEKQSPDKTIMEKLLRDSIKNIKNCDAVILSDYGKGIITKEFAQTIIRQSNKLKKPLLVDPKGSDYSKYEGATLLTPNILEAEVATGIKIVDENSLIKAGQKLLKITKSPYLLITRSENGMSLFFKSGKVVHIPGIKREVFDITGAGDTVISTLALSLGSGINPTDAAYLSNFAGSIKVSKIATQPVWLNELREVLEEKEPASHKIKSREDIKKIVKELKDRNLKIVFTNGCFDILHLGHVRYLKEAKKLGDILIIGLNSDSSVRKLKGKTRPYLPELERAEILASLESVDYVVLFKETRPDNLIKVVKPDIHVKGGDYDPSTLPEKTIVEKFGGNVVVIPVTEGKSTTNIVKKILETKN